MARLIVLDAGVVGLLCSSPMLQNVTVCRRWMERQLASGAKFLISDLTDFEVRRELLRLRAMAKLRRLDDLEFTLGSSQITLENWRKAAEFWALVRQSGKPTASPDALDGDAILAAVAAMIGKSGDEVVIASTNVGHLGRFPGVDARRWEAIPQG